MYQKAHRLVRNSGLNSGIVLIFDERTNVESAMIVLILSLSDYVCNDGHVAEGAVVEGVVDGKVGRIVENTIKTL